MHHPVHSWTGEPQKPLTSQISQMAHRDLKPNLRLPQTPDHPGQNRTAVDLRPDNRRHVSTNETTRGLQEAPIYAP